MAKGKITITGIPEKEPKRHENGNVDLVFKMEQSTAIPKGLEPLKECACLVHIAPKTWKKVEGKVQPESKLLVQGEVKSSVNKKGVAFLEVVAMDIGLIEKREQLGDTAKKEAAATLEKQPSPRGIETPQGTEGVLELSHIKIPEHLSPPNPEAIKEVVAYVLAHQTLDKPLVLKKESNVLLDGYKRYLAAKEVNLQTVPITYTKPPQERKPQRGQAATHPSRPAQSPWYRDEDVVQVKVHDIRLTEPIHYEAKNIGLPKQLSYYVEHPEEKLQPVVLRKQDDKYSLVTGMQRYFLAKILGLEQLPAVLTELSHEAFMKEQGWVEYGVPARGKK